MPARSSTLVAIAVELRPQLDATADELCRRHWPDSEMPEGGPDQHKEEVLAVGKEE